MLCFRPLLVINAWLRHTQLFFESGNDLTSLAPIKLSELLLLHPDLLLQLWQHLNVAFFQNTTLKAVLLNLLQLGIRGGRPAPCFALLVENG